LDDSTHHGLLKKVLALAAFAEALTGVVLIVCPSIVVKLLFEAKIAGIAVITSQFAGLTLMSLGVACWPRGSSVSALNGMLTYSSLATFGLLYLAAGGKWNGPLLWPAIVLHAVLTLLLTWAWFKPRHNTSGQS
jgi:hypothetical protein